MVEKRNCNIVAIYCRLLIDCETRYSFTEKENKLKVSGNYQMINNFEVSVGEDTNR